MAHLLDIDLAARLDAAGDSRDAINEQRAATLLVKSMRAVTARLESAFALL